MDTSSKTELTMEPPAYGFVQHARNKKTVIIACTTVALVLIAVIAILIGVFVTQKHYENILQQTITGSNGQKTDQTVTVNNKENVATFYSTTGNSSATVVYDYSRKLLGYKATNKDSCLVVKLENEEFPSLDEVVHGFQNGEAVNANEANDDKKLTISATSSEVVDRTVLGATINALCGNDRIYWAKQGNGNGRIIVYYYCYCLYYYYYNYNLYCYRICYYYY
ncbi:gastrokine-2-like [Protopterus annectens]|uniref:gastrokine-2-like n=1 Tax=Protopterus annectens TaxID=7888 RepID=UPI001CFBD9FC|nr:gastrokine-2-like [Protopterus annectens]